MPDPGEGGAPDAPTEPFGGEELRRRATGGALLLGARGALILLLGVGANVLLARLLEPRDFGLVALGSVLTVVGGYLAAGGLGAALIRRPEAPRRRELEAVNGVQLAATVALALAFAAGALPFGRDGAVVAVMVTTLPITILRTPAIIALERELDYRAIAAADVVEAITFYTWSVTTVVAGMGVWGMATGMVVRAAAGTAVLTRMGPLGFVRPRWSWPEVRPLLAFGAKVQSVVLIVIAREQGINVAVAATAGIATLGVWNLAWRVLQVPITVFAAVGRVSYPAMARLLAAGEDPRPAIERGLGALALATALVLVAIVGFAPALPELVGDAWSDVPETLLWASLALIVGAPLYEVVAGYLYAADRVGTVVRAGLVLTACWFAVTLPLLPDLGAPAVGIGWVAAWVATAILLARAAAQTTGAAVTRSLGAPTAAAVLGGAVAWLIGTETGPTVLSGAAGALAGEVVLLATLVVVRRALLQDTFALLARARTS